MNGKFYRETRKIRQIGNFIDNKKHANFIRYDKKRKS